MQVALTTSNTEHNSGEGVDIRVGVTYKARIPGISPNVRGLWQRKPPTQAGAAVTHECDIRAFDKVLCAAVQDLVGRHRTR